MQLEMLFSCRLPFPVYYFTHICYSFSQHGVYIIFQGTKHRYHKVQYILSELKMFWETMKRWCVHRSQMLPDQTNHLQIFEPSLTETIKLKSWFHAFTFSTSIYRLSSHENSQATCCRLAFIINLQTKVYFLAWQQIKQPARKSSLQGNGNKPTKCQNHGVIWTWKIYHTLYHIKLLYRFIENMQHK